MHHDQIDHDTVGRISQLDDRIGSGPLLRTDAEVTGGAVRALRRRTRRRALLGSGAVAASVAAAALVGPQLVGSAPSPPVAGGTAPATGNAAADRVPEGALLPLAGRLPASLQLNPSRDEMLLVPGIDDTTGLVADGRCRVAQRVEDPIAPPSVAVHITCPGEPDLFGVSAGRGAQGATAIARAEPGVTWESFLADASSYIARARAERADGR